MKHSMKFAGAIAAVALFPVPAFAHHMMDGQTPRTLAQGLLSGLGHPIIGVDHFAAIVGVGLVAALVGRGVGLALAFSAAMIAGVVLHVLSADIPAAELLVGATTVALGLIVAFRLSVGALIAAALFAAAGLVHGYALGESIVGAEPTPLGAYLAGLLVIQSMIAMAAYAAVRGLLSREAQVERLAMAGLGALIVVAGGVTAVSAAGILG